MTDVNENTVATVIFGLVALLVGSDLLADAGSGASVFHLGTETVGAGLAGVGAMWSWRRYLGERREAAEWRARADELLADVGRTVDTQFATWTLTPAEAEVALLLLKGLSTKEIAAVRDTTDRTTREQARAVYKKAGVAGRAELSAWFIEDLLPPR